MNYQNNSGASPKKSAMPGGSRLYRLAGILGSLAILMLVLMLPVDRYGQLLALKYSGIELATGGNRWLMFGIFAVAQAVAAIVLLTKHRDTYRAGLLNLYVLAALITGISFALLFIAQISMAITGIICGMGWVYIGMDWALLSVFTFLALIISTLCNPAVNARLALLITGILGGLGGCAGISLGAHTSVYGAFGCAMLFVGCACGIAFYVMYGKQLPGDDKLLNAEAMPRILAQIKQAVNWVKKYPLEFIPDSANVSASGQARPANYRRLAMAVCFIVAGTMLSLIGAFVPAYGSQGGSLAALIIVLRLALPELGLLVLTRASTGDRSARRMALILWAAALLVTYPGAMSIAYLPFCAPAEPLGLLSAVCLAMGMYILLSDVISGKAYAASTAPLWKLLSDDVLAALHIEHK